MVVAKWQNLNLPSRQVATHGYSAPYSIQVHEGFTLKNGEEAPSRAWVDLSISEFDPITSWEELLEKSKTGAIDSDLKQTFVLLSELFGKELQSNLENPIWEWPRTTYRQNGEVVTSPRDIIDLRVLFDSYSVEIK